MRNRRIFNLLLSGCLGLCVLILTAGSGLAQGRYVNVYSKSKVKGYINRLEKSSNTFRKDFDRYMDRSNLNGTDTEDRYNALVKDYENALDRLRDQFDRRNNWWETRSEVQEVIHRAQPVNSIVNGLPFSRNIERQWRSMRDDINKVADTYDLPGLNGGGWNGGGGWPGNPGNPGNPGSGGATSTPPGWAQGTWYAVNGNNELTISRNGTVSHRFAGVPMQGRYYRGTIYIGTDQATISQAGRNLRFRDNRTGAITDYSKNGFGGGNGGGGASSPPNWAVGNWASISGGSRTLVISFNGPVSLYVNGNITSGNWERGRINLGGTYYTISSSGGDLRLHSQNSRQYETFRRRP